MADLQQTIQQLTKNINGEVALPGSRTYEQSSTTLFAKGAPALVVLPKTSADLVKTIAFARNNDLIISVRNGGHSNAGYSTNVGGAVIDMRHFDEIKIVDKTRRVVRVGAGATWEMAAKALQPHGWAISSGDTKTVGVAGLTLSGGIGWLVRRDGLAIDNLVAAELVTADGQTLQVSSTEQPDLFWAIRGGGGNFGIVTSFDFAAQPTSHVFAGTVTYDLKDLPETLLGWRDYMRTAPEELTSMFFIMPAFGGEPPSAMIMLCYAGGEEAEVMKILEPLLNLGTITSKDIARKPYAEVLEEVHPPADMKIITNNAFVQTLSDELIDVICKNKNIDQMLQLRSLGGAVNRVKPDATAFAHRGNEVLIVAPTFLPPNASKTAIDEALAPWRKIEAFSNGVYSGLVSEDTSKIMAAAYPASTYQKLAHIKKQYDPANVFNQNYNIDPKE